MKALFTSFFVGAGAALCAQDFPRKDADLSVIADELHGVEDEGIHEDVYENLVQLFAHPIDLNKASADDLRFSRILTEEQIKNIIAYRTEQGNFVSIYELQAVPGLDLQTLYRLAPFVRVTDPSTSLDQFFWQRIRKESESYFLFRYEHTLQRRKGFLEDTDAEDRFEGSDGKLYLRFRSSNPGDFSIGFTAEKDPGETIHWAPARYQYGFDHLSMHAQVQNKGRIKNLIVGDFQHQYGQGLMLGGPLSMGKSGETITVVRKSNVGLLPYTSAYETGYLRGLAGTVEVNRHVFVTGFWSRVKRDAHEASDSLDGPTITSFQLTGLHRNARESADRKKISEENIGTVLQYTNDLLDAGLMFHQTRFGATVDRTPAPYNQFAFEGSHNSNAGIYINYTFLNVATFGEFARSLRGGSAWVAGALLSVTSRLDISILHRTFDRNFYSFYSGAFAEGSTSQNESGTYWGWKYRFNRKFTTTGYVDLFRFPWLKYRSYMPSAGHEWLMKASYQPSRKVLLYAQLREEKKVRNYDGDPNLYQTTAGRKRNYAVVADYGIGQKFRMKTRAQFSTFRSGSSFTKGSAIVQDVSIEISRIQVTARYALFDTEDYDNRQYVYENDVWLAYSLPAYNGRGVRNYVLVEYKMNRHLTFWVRYSHTRYSDREEIGSGLDLIRGNTRNDIKFETRIRF
jgi:hypothetical protein